jgi:hypothetical protein
MIKTKLTLALYDIRHNSRIISLTSGPKRVKIQVGSSTIRCNTRVGYTPRMRAGAIIGVFETNTNEYQ